MILKDYQTDVVEALKKFYTEAENVKSAIEKLYVNGRSSISYVSPVYDKLNLSYFADKPKNGLGESYPRFCLKIPTGGGKTLLAIEAIREYHNLFVKKRTGLVVWIVHREIIYRQTIEKLKDKNHIYRQWLDQCSGNRTIILEKGQSLRHQDTEDNLVILMLMIQSAGRTTKENMKVFQDSGDYIDFFPQDNRYDEHQKLLEKIPNLDFIQDDIFNNNKIVKSSLGNAIRILNPLIIVDEFHTMFSDIAKKTLDGLNPSMIIGLSATPKERSHMNVLVEIKGRQLKKAGMIKLDLHLHSPSISGNWHEMINEIIKKRDSIEEEAIKLNSNRNIYIRPIALIQVERTGKDQREKGKVHSEDVREYLIEQGVPAHEIAVKSSEIDEIREEKLLSQSSEIRYIITKEALKEGWDCSFAYILGIIPNARSESSMTQLVGRILRQPYAKKIGIKELDESYVYFNQGDTEDVLKNIQKGFENEGLGDLIQNISRESGPAGSKKIKTKVKPEILEKYPESLYLPVWIIKNNESYRRFSYHIDIKPNIDWSKVNYGEWLKNEIFPLLDEKPTTYEILVDLDKKYEKKYLEEKESGLFEISYLTRRITDVTDNAFAAFDLANDFIKEYKEYKNEEKLIANSGFITHEIIKKLLLEKLNQEEKIFNSLIESKKLILAVCDDQDIGYLLPEEYEVYPEGIETYKSNLFEKSDKLSMNPLEIKVANLIDNKKSVVWWVRNVAENKKWYSISGWKKNKIHPDFIAAKKNKDDQIELVYIIESKGEHLLGNLDTQYKKNVFNKMNNEEIKSINLKLIKFKLNEDFSFELVEEDKEDFDINRFFNL